MKYFIANWKSNHDINSTKIYFEHLNTLFISQQTKQQLNEIIIAPPFNLLNLSQKLIEQKKLNIKLATQNLSPYQKGAFTGEIGIDNLNGLSVKYAILGHSERRKIFLETSQLIAKKIILSLANNITPILCLDLDYLEEQASFIPRELFSQLIIAYEPLEAIGTGNNQDPLITKKNLLKIRNVFGTLPILYGGSVNPKNISDYLTMADGVLIGGSSLDPNIFFQLINS